MNAIAKAGDNNPPSPIDEALAPYGDFISEAETWADGAEVENEGQMKAVGFFCIGSLPLCSGTCMTPDHGTRFS